MVESPQDHPWSSYGRNALGAESTIAVPHQEYLRLGVTDAQRQETYRQLVAESISADELVSLRVPPAAARTWHSEVPGSDRSCAWTDRHNETAGQAAKDRT